jgi:hypothetical protein
VVVERFIEVNKAFQAARNIRKLKKTGGFTHFLAYKSPKTPFFTLKYLARYNPELFFDEYINCKIFHYLSHCGVVPVQSFGSHILPQQPGLRLRATLHDFYLSVITIGLRIAVTWRSPLLAAALPSPGSMPEALAGAADRALRWPNHS